MESQVQMILEPFVERRMFSSTAEAARKLASEYVTKHIQSQQRKVARMERKYGKTFREFEEYLHQRSRKLQSLSLKPNAKKRLGRAIMNEEEDWLEWKATCEALDRWMKLERDLK
ncbi:hypothetical protein ANRL3_01964 [Anaerolineae bacterium]|nr:hypothetical protein ANRL3_01964 [Anaerolineae bacterium]